LILLLKRLVAADALALYVIDFKALDSYRLERAIFLIFCLFERRKGLRILTFSGASGTHLEPREWGNSARFP
jgi:hypothetical protein